MSKSPMKLKKTIKNIFAALVVVVSVLFIFTYAVPRIAGCKSFYVSSQSMNPTIAKGSLVVTRNVDFDDIKKGDILTFADERTGKSFTHRVEEIYSSGRQLVTKGDANSDVDPYTTSYKCVQGRVVLKISVIGYPMLFVNTVVGKIIAVLAYIFWLAFEIEAFRSRKKEGDPQ